MRKSVVALLLVCTFLMVGCGANLSNNDTVDFTDKGNIKVKKQENWKME